MVVHLTGRSAANRRNLVQESRDGSREAFRLLYDAHRDRAYTAALHLLRGDHAGAEDVCQEAFVKAFQKLGTFRGEAEFGTWLHRIVVNACMDELRRRARSAGPPALSEQAAMSDLPDPSDASSPEAVLLQREMRGKVMEALATLSAALREAVELRYLENRSYVEIASLLQVPQGTVAARLSRGLEAMGRKLAIWGERP
jgi:RNA polymerase sigma-70 factor (ECF subfamily)